MFAYALGPGPRSTRPSAAPAPRSAAGTAPTATTRSSAPGTSSPASGPTTCAPAPTPRRTTTTATAPSSPRWRPATPTSTRCDGDQNHGTFSGHGARGPARGLQGLLVRTRPRRRRLLELPTWSRRSTRRSPTGSTYSTWRWPAPRARHRRPGAARRGRAATCSSPPPPATTAPGPATHSRGSRPWAAPPAPVATGRLTLPRRQPSLTGAMTATRGCGRPRSSSARVHPGARAVRPRRPGSACPGRLDAGRVGRPARRLRPRRWWRGSTSPRPSRSPTASGMVLVNRRGNGLGADFHALPTLHLGAADGRTLRSAARAARAADRPAGARVRARRDSPRLLPDLRCRHRLRRDRGARPRRAGRRAARGHLPVGQQRPLGPAPPVRRPRPRVVSGYAARDPCRPPGLAGRPGPVRADDQQHQRRRRAGLAAPGRRTAPTATWRSAPGWSTTCRAAPGAARSTGSPRERAQPAVGAARQRPRPAEVTRRVTNVGSRAMYYSAQAWGFTSHRVQVFPAALRIAPGETRTMRIRVSRAPRRTTSRRTAAGSPGAAPTAPAPASPSSSPTDPPPLPAEVSLLACRSACSCVPRCHFLRAEVRFLRRGVTSCCRYARSHTSDGKNAHLGAQQLTPRRARSDRPRGGRVRRRGVRRGRRRGPSGRR